MIPKAQKRKMEKVRAKWRSGFPNRGVPAAAAAAQHDQMTKELGHAPDADELVVAALDPENAYHEIVYDCSKAVAVERYRRDRAGDALSALKQVLFVVEAGADEGSEVEVPYTFSIVEGHEETKGAHARRVWFSPEATAADPARMEQVVEGAWAELESWAQRYEHLTVFAGVAAAVTALRLSGLGKD